MLLGQTSNDGVCQDGSDKDKDKEEEFNSIVKNLWKLFKKGNRFKRENCFGNGGDRFDRGHRSKAVGSSRGKRNCYGCGSKNHIVDDCLKAKMNKAFVGGAWSDSEDGDQMEKDAKCLMAIGSQKGEKESKELELTGEKINYSGSRQGISRCMPYQRVLAFHAS
ncbi:putative reverse transcriptase domain-containing protein [Tanacetum coccineum]|uniref:Reverse transcriptase domain-containing protein n=1 Tax=Tanacetum coccineum TaxID=301880 RepID=A0ABQ5CFG5_9ASTR